MGKTVTWQTVNARQSNEKGQTGWVILEKVSSSGHTRLEAVQGILIEKKGQPPTVVRQLKLPLKADKQTP